MRNESPRLRRRLPLLILIGIAVIIVIVGLISRWSRADQLRDHAATQSAPTVALIAPTPVTGTTLALPGRIEAWSRAPIYARVSGYLKRWNVDIGGTVKAGQVLAEIETPDLDQQLAQAQAELASARSEATQATATARRWQSLLASDSVSRQDAEDRSTDAEAKQAQVKALQANVERTQALQQYKHLVAPFGGIVTTRNTDVGALINVGMNPGSELFVVSDTHRLRVYVSVPQRQVAAVRVGGKAQLSVPERPGQHYEATVQSLAQAIDVGSGAMLVQLSVDNPSGELLPGAFATVNFDSLPASDQVANLGLPPSALIIGKDGTQVAIVDAQGHAQLRRITIARDLGNVVELADGLKPGERVIDSPPEGISNGDPVRIAATNPTEQKEAAK
jgi:RND family efflux transporter MFP subunit